MIYKYEILSQIHWTYLRDRQIFRTHRFPWQTKKIQHSLHITMFFIQSHYLYIAIDLNQIGTWESLSVLWLYLLYKHIFKYPLSFSNIDFCVNKKKSLSVCHGTYIWWHIVVKTSMKHINIFWMVITMTRSIVNSSSIGP